MPELGTVSGERGLPWYVGRCTRKNHHPPALDRAALASPRSSTTDHRYLPSGGRKLGDPGTDRVVLWRLHVRSFGRAMECELECVSEGEWVCVSPCPAIEHQPQSRWLDCKLLPVWARMRPNAVSPCRILSSWSHITGTTAHPHTYRPTRRPGSPSRPVCTSGFLQHAQEHAAGAIQHRTSHHIIGSALQYAHAPQIAPPDGSVSPRLGCCAQQVGLDQLVVCNDRLRSRQQMRAVLYVDYSSAHNSSIRLEGETGQGFLKQLNTLRSGIANGNEASRSALCIVRFR